MTSEIDIQHDIVAWFRNNYCLKHHKPRYRITPIINETNNYLELKTKMYQGLDKGASDLLIVLDGKVLFVELKTAKGKQSINQIDYQSTVEKLGHNYYIIRSLDEFKNLINNFIWCIR